MDHDLIQRSPYLTRAGSTMQEAIASLTRLAKTIAQVPSSPSPSTAGYAIETEQSFAKDSC